VKTILQVLIIAAITIAVANAMTKKTRKIKKERKINRQELFDMDTNWYKTIPIPHEIPNIKNIA
jgi:hypothetical protein|tara:strand:+ start:5077 stop:5268 length:192 start_codon:yes stop_codon:yes gene_type:complete